MSSNAGSRSRRIEQEPKKNTTAPYPRTVPSYQAQPSRPQHGVHAVSSASNALQRPMAEMPNTVGPVGAEYQQSEYSASDWVIHIGPITIRIRLWYGPKESITDSQLFSKGIEASQMLDCRDAKLPKRYKRHTSEFFSAGRVFAVPWSEETSTIATTGSASQALTELQFVVVRCSVTFCSALRISAHRGHGAQLEGVVAHEHGVIYTGRTVPNLLPDERQLQLRPHAIRVKSDPTDQQLDPASRINYGQVYSVTFGVPVRPIGKVHEDSLAALHYTFQHVWDCKINLGSPQGRTASAPEAAQSTPKRDSGIITSSGSQSQRSSVQTDSFNMAKIGAVLGQSEHAHPSRGQALRTDNGKSRHSTTSGAKEVGIAASDAYMQSLSFRAQRFGADISTLSQDHQQRLARGTEDQQLAYLLRLLQIQNPARHAEVAPMVQRRRQQLAQKRADLSQEEEETSEEEE